jgi:unsaturated rhamnogalacturonyl hydrolase
VRRRTLILNSIGLAASSAAAGAAGKAADGPGGLIEKAAAAGLALQRFSWEHGILAQAMLDAGRLETVVLMTKGAMLNQDSSGRLAAVGGGATDPGMGAIAYWRAGQISGDPRIREAADRMIEFLLKTAPRAEDGTLYHVAGAPEIWSDSFNTAAPALAATGHFTEALVQVDGLRKRLWDPRKKLLSHIWNDGTKTFKRKDCWGGGQGWTAAALARIIPALPTDRAADRTRLTAFLRELLDGCLAHQRPDGLFHDVVDRPDTFVETNLAQMLAFSIYAGTGGGWLPPDYLRAADRMRAAARSRMDRYGLIQGACGAPRFDSPGISVEAQAFFVMMEVAAGNRRRG